MTKNLDKHLKIINFPEIGKTYVINKDETKFVYKGIFEDKEYIQHGIELKPGDIVFDVGANIGLFTLFVCNKCNNNATIFAFEPIPYIYHCLEKNIKLHKLDKQDNIKLFNLGLTHTNGPQQAIFAYYKNVAANSTLKLDEKQQLADDLRNNPQEVITILKQNLPIIYLLFLILFPLRTWLINKLVDQLLNSEKIMCQLTTVSNIWRDHAISHIDLLKIDVEGAELDVLQGIEGEHWPKIKQIVMEAHDVGDRIETIKELLTQKGFKQINIIQPEFATSPIVNNYNIYATKNTTFSYQSPSV